MIIIAHSTKSPSSSIRYAMNPKKNTFLESNTGFENQNEIIKFFNHHSQLHPTRDKAIHFKIAAHPGDRMDRGASIAVTREVMGKLKFLDCPYVAVLHTNTDVEHIHLVVSRINFDGRLIHQSLAHYSVLKPLAREIEVKYGLKKISSLNRSTDSFLTLKEKQSALKGFNLRKGELRENIKEALYQTYDLNEFISACAERKTEVRVRLNAYNRPIGISYSYEGQNCSGTRLGNGYTMEKVLAKIESNSSTRYDPVMVDPKVVREIVKDSYNNATDWREFSMLLRKQKMEIEPSRDDPKTVSVTVDQETFEFRFSDSAHQILLQWFKQFMDRENEEEAYRKRCENVNGYDGFNSSTNNQPKRSQDIAWPNDAPSTKKSRGM